MVITNYKTMYKIYIAHSHSAIVPSWHRAGCYRWLTHTTL